MNYENILKIRDRKRFLRELKEAKKRNFKDNMRFVELHALWLKRKSNRDWSKRQLIIIDQIYHSNKHMRLA